MAQPIARWLELHAQLGAIDTRNYAAQLSARYSCDDLRFCVERDFLDCGLEGGHAKRAAAAAAAQRGDSDSARGPRPRAPTPEPVLSDGESLSPGIEAGDEAALQLGGRPLPPSPRTPGPR